MSSRTRHCGTTKPSSFDSCRRTPVIPVPRGATTALVRAAAADDAEAATTEAPEVTVEATTEPATEPAGATAGRRRPPRLAALRRLPSPPGRRAPIWFAALVVGAIVWGLTAWTVAFHRKKAGASDLPRQFQYNLPLKLVQV